MRHILYKLIILFVLIGLELCGCEQANKNKDKESMQESQIKPENTPKHEIDKNKSESKSKNKKNTQNNNSIKKKKGEKDTTSADNGKNTAEQKTESIKEKQNKKMQKSNDLYDDFLQSQTEYKYYSLIDINSDGVDELLMANNKSSISGTSYPDIIMAEKIDLYAVINDKLTYLDTLGSSFDNISVGIEDGLIRYMWGGSGWSQWAFCSFDGKKVHTSWLSLNNDDSSFYYGDDAELDKIKKAKKYSISEKDFNNYFRQWDNKKYLEFTKIKKDNNSELNTIDDSEYKDGIYHCNHQGLKTTYAENNIVNLCKAKVEENNIIIWGALTYEDMVLDYQKRIIPLEKEVIIEENAEGKAYKITSEEFNEMFYYYTNPSGLGVDFLIQNDKVTQIDIWP